MKRILNIVLSCAILFSCFIPPFEYSEVKAATVDVYGIVNFKAGGCRVVEYTDVNSGKQGYLNSCSAADGAYLGTDSLGRYIFKVAGVAGVLNSNDGTTVEPFYLSNGQENTKLYNSFYRKENGLLKHYINVDTTNYYGYNTITLGIEDVGLQENVVYYSYDGHYFYTDFRAMIDDYMNGGYAHSVNPNNPYYNYYQYISHRSISNHSVDNMKDYIQSMYSKKPSSFVDTDGNGIHDYANESQLYGEELSFMESQNIYGATAYLMYGVASNESAGGRSRMSINRNNLFGHAAYDGNTSAATVYSAPSQSILTHAKKYVSEGYLDPCDGNSIGNNGYQANLCGKGRYNGSHLGDKASGLNVKYASDPYWGEKAAANYYQADAKNSLKDYKKYTIGIKGNNVSYPIYKEADPSSTVLYWTGTVVNYPFLILETVTGPVMNGSNVWYKIQTDPTLSSDRTRIVQDYGNYDHNNNYAYIHSSAVHILKPGTQSAKNRYRITFDPAGGTWSIDQSTGVKTVTAEEYTTPTIDTPYKAGYTFLGWQTELMAATEDTTYVAQWRSNSAYEITFNADGGTFSDGSGTKKVAANPGEVPTIESPTKEGFTFAGWTPMVTAATGNATYTAMWKKIATYDITFDANGGTFKDGNAKQTQTLQQGVMPTEPEAPTRAGYIFKGWDKEITTATENTTYKAVWEQEKKTFQITFDANGGVFEDGKTTQVVDVLEGNIPETPKSPTKKGYRFAGWDKEVTAVTENTTYTASWEAIKTYAITFDANGGTFENGKDQVIVNIEENTRPSAPTPTKEGYVFQGWDKEIEIATENTTYTAIWKELSLDDLEEREGLYYFDSLKETKNKLQIKGYHAIRGIDHTLEEEISFYLVLKNLTTEEEFTQELNRITDKSEITRPVFSSDGKDYTYSWYKGNIDIDELPDGDYELYIVTENNNYYARTRINNKVLKEQVAEFTSQKTLTTRNDYRNPEMPLQFVIRSKKIADKTANSVYNQYTQYRTFAIENNKLHIKGTAYSIGMNLAESEQVNRRIIFENQEDYTTYSYDLGSITNGMYKVGATLNDGLDKTRAWFDSTVDISDIPKGTYTIYIATESNVSDYSELTELLARNLDDVVLNTDGKTYSFTIDTNERYRIEMNVE